MWRPGWRWLAVTAASFGLAAVILAALGAHAIPLRDDRAIQLWNTALLIHLFHTAAMLGVAAIATHLSWRLITFPGLAMAVGVILFSGSLYLRAAGVDLFPSFLAPVGGFVLALAWMGLILVLVSRKAA